MDAIICCCDASASCDAVGRVDKKNEYKPLSYYPKICMQTLLPLCADFVFTRLARCRDFSVSVSVSWSSDLWVDRIVIVAERLRARQVGGVYYFMRNIILLTI